MKTRIGNAIFAKIAFFTELADTDIKGKLYLNHQRDRAEEPECLPDSTKSSLDGVKNLACIQQSGLDSKL